MWMEGTNHLSHPSLSQALCLRAVRVRSQSWDSEWDMGILATELHVCPQTWHFISCMVLGKEGERRVRVALWCTPLMETTTGTPGMEKETHA